MVLRGLTCLLLAVVPAQAFDYQRILAAQTGRGGDRIILERNADDPALIDIIVVPTEGATTSHRGIARAEETQPYLAPNAIGWVTVGGLGCAGCDGQDLDVTLLLDRNESGWQVISYLEMRADTGEIWKTTICSVSFPDAEARLVLGGDLDTAETVTVDTGPVPLATLSVDYRPEVCGQVDLNDAEWEAWRAESGAE